MSAIPLLFFLKTHIKAHDRRLPSGKVVQVRAHEDKRVKRAQRDDHTADMFAESQADTPGMINVDGTMRPTTNSEGRPIHSTQEGMRNFWRWFAGSKAVDEQGRPMVVYHGTHADITQFGYGHSNSADEGMGSGLGHFFTTSAKYAGDFAEGDSGNVIPAYLRIKHPLVIDEYEGLREAWMVAADHYCLAHYGKTASDLEDSGDDEDYRKLKEFYALSTGPANEGYFGRKNAFVQSQLKDIGYDGLLLTNDRQTRDDPGAAVWVAFFSEQVKSSLGNRGTFSPDNPNIIQEPLTDAQFRRQLDLFLDLDSTDAGQSGPETEAAKRAAADAVKSLRGSKRGVLAPRLADTYAARQRVSLVGHTLSSREDLATLAQVYRDPRFETFRLFFVNNEGKIVSQVGLSSRLPAQSAVFVGPDNQQYLDDLASAARKAGATGYYMLHNHPSTNPMPSDTDVNITQAFTQHLPLVNHGHVILDTNEFGVIDPGGDAKIIKQDFNQVSPLVAHELSSISINGPAGMAQVAKRIDADKDAVTLIATDIRHNVLGVTSIPVAELLGVKESTLKLRIRRTLKAMNGARAFAVGSNRRALGPLSDLVIDALHVTEYGDYESVRRSTAGKYGDGNPFAIAGRQVPRITPDTSPEFDYLRDKTLAERKRMKELSQMVGVREGVGTVRKSIILILPSGNEYRLNQSQYRWQVSNLLLKALGPGERWITVHPSGNKDAKGVPVLVRETQQGSGVYHVIGGAGGKLNYLKLRGIRPQSDYKAQARERADARREARQEQAKLDRESGVADIKNEQRAAVDQQERQAQQAFIEGVAKKMGWAEKDYRFDDAEHGDLSPDALRKAADRHHREVLSRAKEALSVLREHTLADPEFREELMSLPKGADPSEALSVADIDPVTPPTVTLGFAPRYEERAAAAGATSAAIKKEAEGVKDLRLTPEQREAAIKRGETREAVKKELQDIRRSVKESLKIELVEAQDAMHLFKLEKAMREASKQAQAARADIDKDQSGKVKAYNLTVGDEPDLDDKVKSDLENDIRTAQTRAFLSTVSETAGKDYEQTLNAALGAGSYNSINALALAAGGDALVDRSVVDVLGPAGAAQVLARRLHADLDAETVDKLVTDFEDFHLHHYMETSKAALDQAANLQAEAKKLQIDEASDATDLALAKSLTEKRMKAIAESQRLLGTALGEMEANAALVAALKAGRTDTPLEVPLGGISPEDAIKQARAIGLQRGDYRLDKVDGNEILTVSPEGLDRLAKPVDVAEVKRARRNLDIIEGREDEENWLPKGVANRADLAMPPANPGVADVLAKPFAPGEDLEQSLKDYIGGRMADGDSPADILSDIQSQTFFDKAGADRFSDYMAALDVVAPLKDAKGKARPVESLRPDFEKLADEFVERHYGGARSPLHQQTFDPNDTTAAESLYRALAEVPEGIAAYKPIGELTNQDQRALREFFEANIAKKDAKAGELKAALAEHDAKEPERYLPDTTEEWKAWEQQARKLRDAVNQAGDETTKAEANKAYRAHIEQEPGEVFDSNGVSPAHQEWQTRRDKFQEQVNAAVLNWDVYTKRMGGRVNAYAAMQDLIKSRVAEKFLDHYNRAHADKPLKRGRLPIRNSLEHADVIDPVLRAQRQQELKQLQAGLQARNPDGSWASDDVTGKVRAARAAEEAMKQAQFNMYGDEEAPEVKATPLKADERYQLGHAAENQISRMVPMMARNFKPGQPFQMWQPSMNGKGVARQRAIKLIEANKHQILALGTGAGKTLVQLGAFAHLQQTGKAKRGLFLCPSIVQSEFRGEAARYLDPHANNGQGFRYHIEPGASREERIAAYKDPKHHFAVMTHSAFRDDMLHLGAQQAGISKDEMSARMIAMKPDEQAAWLKGVMDQAGINFDYVSLDEAQVALNREGKRDSALAGIVGGLSRNSPYFVMASADPVKNDKSEIFSALQYMDPKRYSDRAAFMRRYGADTPGSESALKAELTNYVYAHKIDPEGVKALKQTVSVDLTDDQYQAITDLRKHLASARMARMSGQVDVPAVKALMPEHFEGVPEAQHEAVAKELQRNLGFAKETAMGRIIDDRSVSAKYQKAVDLANERKGKPGIIFAHRIESVHELARKLEAEGHIVTVLTGKDSPDEKARKVREYKAKGGILVASDSASTGMNAQNAQWVVQYDTPQTALTHHQRGARAYRTGQKNDVELIDLVANHDYERRARDRLAKKYELRDLMTSPVEAADDTGLAYYLKKRDSMRDSLF